MMKFSQATILALTVFTLQSTAMAACSDPAGPNVNWQGCDKSYAELNDANLHNANLSGVNLTGADLRGNAKLGGTIKPDGGVI